MTRERGDGRDGRMGLIADLYDPRTYLGGLPLGRCDVPQDLSADLPIWALADVMGVPTDDRKLLLHWANRVIGFQDPEYAQYDEQGKPIDPRSRRALADMYVYAHELAKQ